MCRVWFLIAWKENLVDLFVRLEKKKRVSTSCTSIPAKCPCFQVLKKKPQSLEGHLS